MNIRYWLLIYASLGAIFSTYWCVSKRPKNEGLHFKPLTFPLTFGILAALWPFLVFNLIVEGRKLLRWTGLHEKLLEELRGLDEEQKAIICNIEKQLAIDPKSAVVPSLIRDLNANENQNQKSRASLADAEWNIRRLGEDIQSPPSDTLRPATLKFYRTFYARSAKPTVVFSEEPAIYLRVNERPPRQVNEQVRPRQRLTGAGEP